MKLENISHNISSYNKDMYKYLKAYFCAIDSIRQKKYEYDKERGKRYKILQNENL